MDVENAFDAYWACYEDELMPSFARLLDAAYALQERGELEPLVQLVAAGELTRIEAARPRLDSAFARFLDCVEGDEVEAAVADYRERVEALDEVIAQLGLLQGADGDARQA